MFIRFVTGQDIDDPYWSTGVICNAREMIEKGLFEDEFQIVAKVPKWIRVK